MILPNFKVFKTNGRLLALDWGARRTGVAVSGLDGEFVFARPVINIKQYSHDWLVDRVVEIANNENVSGIVIGLPLRTDGTESETTAMVRDFANVLATKTELPLIFVDETLTSATAMEQMGHTTRDDIKRELDSNSACVILENAISLMKRN